MCSLVRCSSTVGCCFAYDDTYDDICTQTPRPALIVSLVLGFARGCFKFLHYMSESVPISVLLEPLSGVHRAARRGLLPLPGRFPGLFGDWQVLNDKRASSTSLREMPRQLVSLDLAKNRKLRNRNLRVSRVTNGFR